MLFHDQLGDIDLEMGRDGRYGASQIIQQYPDLAADIETRVAGAELVEETATRAALRDGDTTFNLIKRDGRWSLAGVERDTRVNLLARPINISDIIHTWKRSTHANCPQRLWKKSGVFR